MKLLSLREKATSKNETSLFEYMQYIYSDEEIVCDSVIPEEVQRCRCIEYSVPYIFKKYRPDIRIESKSLIVEFEGIQHFQNVTTIMIDEEREAHLKSLGYKIIRIPFYIQLTKDMIKFYFNEDVEYGSEVPSGFYSLTSDYRKLNPHCPANFCSLGYQRFIREFREYPESTQKEIVDSLRDQQAYNIGVTVLPNFTAVDELLIESRRFLDDKNMFHPFTPWCMFEPDDLYEIHKDGGIEHWT